MRKCLARRSRALLSTPGCLVCDLCALPYARAPFGQFENCDPDPASGLEQHHNARRRTRREELFATRSEELRSLS